VKSQTPIGLGPVVASYPVCAAVFAWKADGTLAHPGHMPSAPSLLAFATLSEPTINVLPRVRACLASGLKSFVVRSAAETAGYPCWISNDRQVPG
jgi:hypothetical protein